MYKEVTKFRDLYSTIPEVSDPVADILFILNAKPSPTRGRWWRALITLT